MIWKDLCNYKKALIIPDMPDDFKVADKFRHGLTDDEIRKGIAAFRKFLYALFDKLTLDKDAIDAETRDNYNPYIKHDRADVRMCFPTIVDLEMILFTFGIRGKLKAKEKKLSVRIEDLLTVICEKTENYISLIKMSNERKLEMLRILTDLGFRFNGVDFSKEVDFSKTEEFDITFSGNDSFVVGLKLIAEATANHRDYYYIMNIFNVIEQCDFYPLANVKPKKRVVRINEYANLQTPEIGAWIMDIHRLLMNNNCTMVRSDGNFQYAKRGKNVAYGMVCIIDIRITGCSIIPGVNHLECPESVVDLLSDGMVSMLKNGASISKFDVENCKRRFGNMAFARFTFAYKGEEFEGCRHAVLGCQFSGDRCRFNGYRFDLTDSIVRELTKKWIEMELRYTPPH